MPKKKKTDLAALIEATLLAAKLSKPIKVVVSDKEIELQFAGDYSSAAPMISNALQNAGVNYDDPRAKTIDLNARVVDNGPGFVKTTMLLTRLDKAAYDKILLDGELMSGAPDADGDGRADDTGAKLAQ